MLLIGLPKLENFIQSTFSLTVQFDACKAYLADEKKSNELTAMAVKLLQGNWDFTNLLPDLSPLLKSALTDVVKAAKSVCDANGYPQQFTEQLTKIDNVDLRLGPQACAPALASLAQVPLPLPVPEFLRRSSNLLTYSNSTN